jgi:hypothetical protein
LRTERISKIADEGGNIAFALGIREMFVVYASPIEATQIAAIVGR